MGVALKREPQAVRWTHYFLRLLGRSRRRPPSAEQTVCHIQRSTTCFTSSNAQTEKTRISSSQGLPTPRRQIPGWHSGVFTKLECPIIIATRSGSFSRSPATDLRDQLFSHHPYSFLTTRRFAPDVGNA